MSEYVTSELRSLEPSARDWMKRVIGDLFYQFREAQRSETTPDLDWLMKIFTEQFLSFEAVEIKRYDC